MIKLSEVYDKQWKFEKAEETLADALRIARLRDDSVSVYQNLLFHYYQTGEVDKFIDTADKHFNLLIPDKGPPMMAAFLHLQFGGLYAVMGQEKRVHEI